MEDLKLDKVLRFNIQGHYGTKLHICTACGHHFISSNAKECPTCKTKKFTYVKGCDKRIYVGDFDNTISYGYICNIESKDDIFNIEYKIQDVKVTINEGTVGLELTRFENQEPTVIKLEIFDERTKRGTVRTVGKLYCNEKETRFIKQNIEEAFSYSINTEEIVKLGVCPPNESHLSDMIWRTYTNYKKFRFLIIHKLGMIEYTDGQYQLQSTIDHLKANPLILEKLKEKISGYIKTNIEKVEQDSTWYETYYSHRIKSDFPSNNPKFYDIREFLEGINDYYYDNRYPDEMSEYFATVDYSQEEITAFLQAMYRQNFSWSYNNPLTFGYKLYKELGIEYDKIPKEMDIHCRRIKMIKEYEIKLDKASNLRIGNVCLEKEGFLESMKKIVGYNNNFKFLNLVLFKSHGKASKIMYNIKGTDYFIFKEKSEVLEIYYKTELQKDCTIDDIIKLIEESNKEVA